MYARKYSLNEQTLLFIQEFENNVELGKTFTTQELADEFEASAFNKEKFNTYKKTKNNAIWWALTCSGNWLMVKRGTNKRK